MPAADPAATPGGLSSMTTQREGSTFITSATCRKRSGAGLPRATLIAENTWSPKNRSTSVMASEVLMRSGALDDANTEDHRPPRPAELHTDVTQELRLDPVSPGSRCRRAHRHNRRCAAPAARQSPVEARTST